MPRPPATTDCSSPWTCRCPALASETCATGSRSHRVSALRTFFEGARHPHWWWRFLTRDVVGFECVSDRAADPSGRDGAARRAVRPVRHLGRPRVDPPGMERPVRAEGSRRPGRRRAGRRRPASRGSSCRTTVAVSSTGARPPSTRFPPIVDAVGRPVEVLFDSGIRRGARHRDRARPRGIRACLIGRAYLYGLGTAGERGVDRAIELLTGELRRSMQLVGARTVRRARTVDRERHSSVDDQARRRRRRARRVRRVRALPAALPHVPSHRRRVGVAARPHRRDACGAHRWGRRCVASSPSTWTCACSAAPARRCARRRCRSVA